MAVKKASEPGYIFPTVPRQWNVEEQRFALGLRSLFDRLFWKKASVADCYPIGIVVLTAENKAPFPFGTWAAVATGIQGVYGWKRTQ